MNNKSVGSKEAADKLVKNIRRKTARKYSAEEKIRIVLDHQIIVFLAILVILVVGIAAELKILVALRNTDPGLVILGQDIIFLDGGAAGGNQE
jgi:hypothetical protein